MKPDTYGARTLAEPPTHWNRYLAQLKSFCSANLLEKRRAELLEQSSRPDVRNHQFKQWVSEQNVPALITNRSPIQLPRFQYCLYVDKQCLDTVIQLQEANDGTALFVELLPLIVFAVVDRAWTPDGTDADDDDDGCDEAKSEEDEEDEIEDEGGYPFGPFIDGSDRKYVGRVYCPRLVMKRSRTRIPSSFEIDRYSGHHISAKLVVFAIAIFAVVPMLI
ncbi:hypothetical protein CSHISOI_05147 [Colletotrichum shisoi]|uniref:Uncharacterized protein n=1 Tax=Colletotrichum shisoi TaxID=2078593 RepID=A0A5Q4BTF9_9PEZI|nr:hypothetical protein CSHISOI_05147 [Colletotrichum shisoi]